MISNNATGKISTMNMQHYAEQKLCLYIKICFLLATLLYQPALSASDQALTSRWLISLGVITSMGIYYTYSSTHTGTHLDTSDYGHPSRLMSSTWSVGLPSLISATKTIYLDDGFALHLQEGTTFQDWKIESPYKYHKFPEKLTQNTAFKLKNDTYIYLFLTEGAVQEILIQRANQSIRILLLPNRKFNISQPKLDQPNTLKRKSARMTLHMIYDTTQDWGCEINDIVCAKASLQPSK